MHPIVLRGARAHNLKGLDLTLRPGELVGLAGVSGAGKSSLALDTLYAEGQRRFVESFSPYARQFLERLDRPAMDELDPVAAGVAVDRRAPIKSSRSTVATMADIEPYLSALFAREARPLCPTCGILADRSDPESIARRLLREKAGQKAIVTYAVRVDGTELFLDARERLLRAGYRRVLVDGKTRDLDDVAPSELALGAGQGRGRLDVVVDRLTCDTTEGSRLAAALDEAWQRSDAARAEHEAPNAEVHFFAGTSARGADAGAKPETIAVARGLVCPKCAAAFEPPTARLFSYQSPVGACATCKGFGRTIGIDWDKVIPDHRKSLAKGAIRAWSGKSSQMERGLLKKFCARKGISMDAPFGELTAAEQAMVIEGEGSWSGGKYPGVRAWFEYLETRTYKMHVRVLLSRYRAYDLCKACGGKRLSPRSLGYRVAGLDLGAWHALEIHEARDLLKTLDVHGGQGKIALAELEARLGHLERVGLGYLSLDRQARSLSGGEAQRVSLTAALGTHLTGALFVLDEPTVGLHPTDLPPLIDAMRELAARGNVVVVIEHDPLVLRACDRIVELGPGAGAKGGNIVFDGTPQAFASRPDLATARSLKGLGPSEKRRAPKASAIGAGELSVTGARGHNLKGVDVTVPLGRVVAITGPSGSGKSSLADRTIFRTLARMRGHKDIEAPLPFTRLVGADLVKDVLLVDQAPLGRTSRGNPATYTGAWDRVRALFARSPMAEARKLGPGHFSFNVEGGRCDACNGEGAETIEMQFLSDVTLVCPSCQGKRFKPEVLEVRIVQPRYFGSVTELGLSDVLGMTVDDALEVFEADSGIVRALSPLAMLGVGYLTLGQSLSTLSGGEAQRLKLARALSEVKKGTLVVLDEPSAGLHVDEVGLVNDALAFLVQRGASVLAVDHDLDLIGAADWVIELGPGAGARGGTVVAAGTPDDLRRQGDTKTGAALAAHGAPLPVEKRRPAHVEGARAIEVVSAREHNLKDVSTSIPHGKITVVTGPSGSGKSTLAFDVVFAEGQRRFLETLTPYARQFLPTMPRPDVDRVLGIPPAVALEQRTTRSGPNSTVATVTEIAHYLRLLYAKVGDLHCPRVLPGASGAMPRTCDEPISAMSVDDAWQRARELQGPHLLLSPAVTARKGTYLDVFNQASRAGIERAFVDGALVDLADPPRLKKSVEHSIDLVVWEGKAQHVDRPTFLRALSFGRNAVKLRRLKDGKETLLSTERSCPRCGTSVPEMDPRWFSFNTKQGQCAACEGKGEDEDGRTCKTCGGARLAPLPRSVRLHGLRYHEYLGLDVEHALAAARGWTFSGAKKTIAETPRAELLRRLSFVSDVGLDYLSLGRLASTLSGGEMQRLRLAAQLGAGLTGALYVLDEPTIGLHARDTLRLLRNLRSLADTGSTVLLVEHDADTIRAADHLIDLGPTGGRGGGRVVASGPPADVLKRTSTSASPTARALADERALVSGRTRLGPATEAIELSGARAHNLRVDRVDLPVGRLTVVAGVSGSGKSTLVSKVLYPAVRRALGLEAETPLAHDRVVVPKSIQRAVLVDQSPIGRTPRSVPATFLGIWDDLRRLFAASTDAKIRGFTPTRFSFNSTTGGRCTACEGQGATQHEMSFLPDVTTVCPACRGSRFEPETRMAKYLGRDIGEVLDLSAEEAAQVFAAHPRIASPLSVMHDLGVGYLKLGQGSPTLSGGEAQRLKLAAELSVRSHTKPTLYVLDEPTTGLHWSDVVRLVGVLDRLVRRGDTLVVIEHHPGVIACADHVIELGPEGGARGGELIAAMAPQDLAKQSTPTGQVLRDLFRASARKPAHPSEARADFG